MAAEMAAETAGCAGCDDGAHDHGTAPYPRATVVGMEVKAIPGAGLGLCATEDLPARTQVLAEMPVASVSLLPFQCSQCLRPMQRASAVPCPRCLDEGGASPEVYCSDDCRGVAFDNHHKAQCVEQRKGMLHLREVASRDKRAALYIKMAERIIGMACARGIEGLLPELQSLVLPTVQEAGCEPGYMVDLYARLTKSLGLSEKQLARFDYGLFCKLSRLLDVNAFSVHAHPPGMQLDMCCGPDGSHPPAGLAVYELASRFNHSCDPNVVFTINPQSEFGHAMFAYTTRDVARGEQLCITYLDLPDVSQPCPRRQHLLKQTHYFHCACRRCVAETQQGSTAVAGTEEVSNPAQPPQGHAPE
eukprot:m.190961 g.190961  ORF g.190961 m.190961 type:complete len:360 (-) comp18242_c0_seq7:79-1158(-)